MEAKPQISKFLGPTGRYDVTLSEAEAAELNRRGGFEAYTKDLVQTDDGGRKGVIPHHHMSVLREAINSSTVRV